MDSADRLLGELSLGVESVDNRANANLSVEGAWSPELMNELIIRQRGKRRIPDNSGQGQVHRTPFQKTPTKMPSSMILRSSPRKRLTIGSTPEPTDDRHAECSPMKLNVRLALWSDTPTNAKKPRFNETEHPCLAKQNKELPLQTLLGGYSKSQLIKFIVDHVNEHKEEEQFRSRLQTPSIDHYEYELQHAKRNIYKSLPTSRLCKKTDSAAYSRASLHLTELKRLLILHTKELQESCHWDALLDYVIMAWNYVRATPIWDNAVHNATRRQCFKLLTCHCMTAMKTAGQRLGSERTVVLEKHFHDWAKDCEDVLPCITALNKTLTKGRSSF